MTFFEVCLDEISYDTPYLQVCTEKKMFDNIFFLENSPVQPLSQLLLTKVLGVFTKQYGILLMGKQSVRRCCRLLTYPIWLPDQCQMHIWCFTAFICIVSANVLLPCYCCSCWPSFWKLTSNSVYLLCAKQGGVWDRPIQYGSQINIKQT